MHSLFLLLVLLLPASWALCGVTVAATQIVDTLQERLYDLEHAGPEVRPGPDVLQQYQAAVRAIATQLQQPQLPTYCLRVTAQDRLPATSEATAAAATTTASGKGHQTAGSSDKQSALSTRSDSIRLSITALHDDSLVIIMHITYWPLSSCQLCVPAGRYRAAAALCGVLADMMCS